LTGNPTSACRTCAGCVFTVAGKGHTHLCAPGRDRNGTFEPQLIPKYQRRVARFDEKILALYAKGMTTRDIQEIV